MLPRVVRLRNLTKGGLCCPTTFIMELDTQAIPTEKEVMRWFVETAAHSYHIEFFLQRLQVGSLDPDRPHDIVHAHNKFEWPAVKGYALQFRENGRVLFKNEILTSRDYHRGQF